MKNKNELGVAYSYGILKENVPTLYLEQESTLLHSPYTNTKYAIIEKSCFKDGSESINRIIYSDNLEELWEKVRGYISWYDYVAMETKSIQGFVSKLN